MRRLDYQSSENRRRRISISSPTRILAAQDSLAARSPLLANVPVTPGGDQISDAGIDIDIVPQWLPDEEISYTVTIFGWTAIAPRL